VGRSHRLALYRAECGWTQEQLAKEAKVSRDTIRRAEDGHRPWAHSRLLIATAIAKKLNLKVDSLAQEIWP
jgi:DNA-binding XRE family transcriptional regulator